MPTTKKAAPAKKVAVKKTVAKAPVAKKASSAKKSLVYANNETSFWVSDGQILNSLLSLRDAFATMEKAVFSHHVSKEKNDFANWVEVVLGDKACAKDLREAKSPGGAKLIIVRHLKGYTL